MGRDEKPIQIGKLTERNSRPRQNFEMKRLLLIGALLTAATAPVIAPMARAQTTDENQDADAARVQIQAATDDLVAALVRGDAAGALKWMAPDFTLDKRQYLVHDLAWMQQALPLELKRGQFDKLSDAVNSVTFRNGLADTREKIVVQSSWKPEVTKLGIRKSSGYGLEGDADSSWRQTPDGWRLVRGNEVLRTLWYLEPPAPPVAAQQEPEPRSPSPISGLTLQEPLAVFEVQDGGNDNSLTFSPDSKQLAWIYSADSLKIAALDGQTAHPKLASRLFYQVAFDANGALWTSDSDGILRQWNADGTTLKRQWQVAREYANYQISVAPNGKHFAVFNNGTVKLWDADARKSVQVKPAFDVGNIYFSPDSSQMALVSRIAAEVRDASDGHLIQTFTNEHWAGFLNDGQTLVTVATNATPMLSTYDTLDTALRFRAAATGEIKRESPIPNLDIPDWKALNGNPIAGEVNAWRVENPMISPDGKVAVGRYNRFSTSNIGVWDAQTGKLVRMLRGFSPFVTSNWSTVRFSPDSQRLAVSSGQGEIAVWDVSLPQATPGATPQVGAQDEPTQDVF